MAVTPIRRVVTGNDENGKSKVVWDGPAPGTHEAQLPGVSGVKAEGRGHTDFWVWRETPPPLDGKEDAGMWNDEFPCPEGGGHQRVVHWLPKTPDSPQPEGYHEPVQHGRTWDRGGGNHYNRWDGVDTHLAIESDAPPDKIEHLLRNAKAGCFAEGLITQQVPLNSTIEVNGKPFTIEGVTT